MAPIQMASSEDIAPILGSGRIILLLKEKLQTDSKLLVPLMTQPISIDFSSEKLKEMLLMS